MKNIIAKGSAMILSLSLIGTSFPLAIIAEETQPPEITSEEFLAQAEQLINEGVQPEFERTVEKLPEETDKPEAAYNPPAEDIQTSNTLQTSIKLSLGTYQTVIIENAGDYTWLSFTPSETAYYAVEANGIYDTYCEMYEGAGQIVTSDDDSGLGLNFCINRKLQKGKTYYYKTRLYAGYNTGTFTVSVIRDSMLTIVPIGKTELYVTPYSDVNLQIRVLDEDTTGMKIRWYRTDYMGIDYANTLVASNTETYTAANINYYTRIRVEVEDRFGNTDELWYGIHPDNGLSVVFDQPVRYSPPGYNHVLKAYVTANDKSDLKCYWFKKVYIDGGFYPVQIEGANTDTLTTEVLNESTDYIIIVRDKYYNQVQAEADVVVKPQSAVILYDNDVVLPVGSSKQLLVSGPDSLVWESTDSDIASIDQNGLVKGISVGEAEIDVYQKNNMSNYAEGNVTVTFTDTADPSSYYFDPVIWAAVNDITKGHGGAGKFSPNASCTREQIVTFLWRMMGEPEPETASSFTDVAEDAWYYEPITWALENGITTGLNDGTGRFGVGQACTREQCVTFMYRANILDYGGNFRRHKMFTDVAQGKYYFEAISWAYDRGITTGLNNGTGKFGVGQKCTRAMIVAFLYRYREA